MNYDAATGLTRRQALIRGLLGSAGLVIGGHKWAAAQTGTTTPRAKAIIQIWMWGGPAHLDTFDPKPAAGYDYCGPLDTPIATNVDGIQIGQLLPLLAQQADKYTVIRSMTHGSNSHETAAYITQTGHMPDRLVYPCAGAVVSLFKGYDHGYTDRIPPYVVLTEPLGRFSEAGFLGPRYRPFATGGDPNAQRFAVEGIVAEGISDAQQERRRALMHELDTLDQALDGCPEFAALDRCEHAAYELILGDARNGNHGFVRAGVEDAHPARRTRTEADAVDRHPDRLALQLGRTPAEHRLDPQAGPQDHPVGQDHRRIRPVQEGQPLELPPGRGSGRAAHFPLPADT